MQDVAVLRGAPDNTKQIERGTADDDAFETKSSLGKVAVESGERFSGHHGYQFNGYP